MQPGIPENPAAALAAFRHRRERQVPAWALPVLGLALVPASYAVVAAMAPGLHQVVELDVHSSGTVLANVLLGITGLVCTSAASRLSQDPGVLTELVEGRGLEELLPCSTTPAELVDGVARRCVRNGSLAALSFAPALLLAAAVADPSLQGRTLAGGVFALLLLLILLPALAYLSCSTAIWSGDRSGMQLAILAAVTLPPLLMLVLVAFLDDAWMLVAACVLALGWSLWACRRSAIAGLAPPAPRAAAPVSLAAHGCFRDTRTQNPILARERWREARSGRPILLALAVVAWAALCLFQFQAGRVATGGLTAQLLVLACASGFLTAWRGMHLVLEECEKRTLTALASSWSDQEEIVRGYLGAALGSAGRVTVLLAGVIGVAAFAATDESWILPFAALAALAPYAGAAIGVGSAALAGSRARLPACVDVPFRLFFLAAVCWPGLYVQTGAPLEWLPVAWAVAVLGVTVRNLSWGLRATRQGLNRMFNLR